MGFSGFDWDSKKGYFAVGPVKIITHYNSMLYGGFSFWPSARRLSDYKLIGGYRNATFNSSYAHGAGSCESIIGYTYSMMGYHVARAEYSFYNHTGRSVGNYLCQNST